MSPSLSKGQKYAFGYVLESKECQWSECLQLKTDIIYRYKFVDALARFSTLNDKKRIIYSLSKLL